MLWANTAHDGAWGKRSVLTAEYLTATSVGVFFSWWYWPDTRVPWHIPTAARHFGRWRKMATAAAIRLSPISSLSGRTICFLTDPSAARKTPQPPEIGRFDRNIARDVKNHHEEGRVTVMLPSTTKRNKPYLNYGRRQI